MEQVLILVESREIMSLCQGRPRSKAFISLHAWQKQFINCNFASMGKKEGSTSACYLWRFTEVWEMLMWLTFIYNMFQNGPHVHILPLRLSYCTCLRKKKIKDWYRICFAVQEHTMMIFFLRILCHIRSGFLVPSSPSPLSKYLSLCVSVPRWRSGE